MEIQLTDTQNEQNDYFGIVYWGNKTPEIAKKAPKQALMQS